MSNRRSIADFPRNEAGLVDEFIGTAFDAVYAIYKNLEKVLQSGDNADRAEAAALAAAASAVAAHESELDAASSAAAAAQSAADLAQAVSDAIAARDSSEGHAILALGYLEQVQAAAITVNHDRLAAEAAAQAAQASASSVENPNQFYRRLGSRAAIRNYTGTSTTISVFVRGEEWVYEYDPADNTSIDDDEQVIVSTGGRRYKTRWAVQWRPSKTLYDFTTVEQQKDLRAGTGLVDQTSALNAYWQYVKSTFVDVSSEDYVKVVMEIPAALYRIDDVRGVNLTNIKARNTILAGNGAVFHGRGNTNIVDMTGTRWLQMHGLTIFGDEENPPRSGLLLGPQNNETSGNNMFVGTNVTGHFQKTACWNIGSETTTYKRARFANYNQDPDAYTYIADGKMRMGAQSGYAALRAAGVGVSFTNNQFYSCDLRNIGGGSAAWLEFTRGWGFDRGCYFVSYNDSAIKIRQTSDSVHQNLSIEGLIETAYKDLPVPGNTGCKHIVKFYGDNTASILEGFTLKVGVPHATLSCICQDASSGNLTISNTDLMIGHNLTPGVPVFDAQRLTLIGRVQSGKADEMNIDNIASFTGSLVSNNGIQPKPKAGVSTIMSAGQFYFCGSGPRTYDGIYRTDGVADDVPFRGRAKGAGAVILGNEKLINALNLYAPEGSVNGAAIKASLTVPQYTVESVSATLNVGLRSKGTGSKVEIGDDSGSNSYLEVSGISTYAQLQAAGAGTNIDLQLVGKGTGLVRLGTNTPTADTPIVGYVQIKTADGITRKLAVIA